MDKMNSKERFLTAMKNGQADRVPCTPDFSCMIPCRMTGKPYWESLLSKRDTADYEIEIESTLKTGRNIVWPSRLSA